MGQTNKTEKLFAVSHLPLVGRTDIQVTQDSLGSDLVVHSLVRGSIVCGSVCRKQRENAVRGRQQLQITDTADKRTECSPAI